MMLGTILTGLLIATLFVFLLVVLLRKGNVFTTKNVVITCLFVVLIGFAFLHTGFRKIKADIGRILKNSFPKTPGQVYKVLFREPLANCVEITHLKDQERPFVDCCIWMEVKVCPEELGRLVKLKAYEESRVNFDSRTFTSFSDRPEWWRPEDLGDQAVRLQYQFPNGNQQTIFVSADSTRLFICDKAP
jgi:hypothetical protein